MAKRHGSGWLSRLGMGKKSSKRRQRDFFRPLAVEKLDERKLLFAPMPMYDPGFVYVDANNDQLYLATDGDVDITVAIADGRFDTSKAEGGYDTPIPDGGIVFPSTSSVPVPNRWIITAGGDITFDRDIEAAKSVKIVSTGGSVNLDDPTIEAVSKNLVIKAAGDITATSGDSLIAGKQLNLEAGGDIDVSYSTLYGGTKINAIAGGSIYAYGSELGTITSRINLDAAGSIYAADSDMSAPGSGGWIVMNAGDDIDLGDAELVATQKIHLEAGDDITLAGDTLR